MVPTVRVVNDGGYPKWHRIPCLVCSLTWKRSRRMYRHSRIPVCATLACWPIQRSGLSAIGILCATASRQRCQLWRGPPRAEERRREILHYEETLWEERSVRSSWFGCRVVFEHSRHARQPDHSTLLRGLCRPNTTLTI